MKIYYTMMNYVLTFHAESVLRERKILIEYVERTINDPELFLKDKIDMELEHYLKMIPENRNKVLRVILNNTTVPFKIVTVYFDRSMKGKL